LASVTRYWTNNGQRSAFGLNGSAAIDLVPRVIQTEGTTFSA